MNDGNGPVGAAVKDAAWGAANVVPERVEKRIWYCTAISVWKSVRLVVGNAVHEAVEEEVGGERRAAVRVEVGE